MSNELSIFVDESGDFGKYEPHNPYYIVSFIFHEQNKDISHDVAIFESQLRDIGFGGLCIHAAPIIRQEYEYRNMDLKNRRSIFRQMMTFFNKVDITHKTICIDKQEYSDELTMIGKLSKEIHSMLNDNLEYFLSFDKVIVYYDNGQLQLNKILSTVFNIVFEHPDFRKVMPSDYRLFQAADLACTLQLLELKVDNKKLSKSEEIFFRNTRTLKKNYLKPFSKKHFGDNQK